MKYFTLITIFSLLSIALFGQERMYVTAENGLIVRDQPSLKANKIYHLSKNTMVLVSKKTGITLKIVDNGKEINGEWIKIYSFDDSDNYGYVFDSFLTEEKPDIWNSGTMAYYKTYDISNQQNGTHKSKSFSKDYFNEKLPIVKPLQTILDSKDYPYFLNPKGKEIILFKNHDLANLKPVGILKNLVQVRVDSTFYKYTYKDLTNCVWHRIIINDEPFYTDVDIHDYSISKELIKLNQNLIIVGQYTGFEGAYHLSHPEFFFFIFTNLENKIIHRTEILDFYLNDEFAMEEDILNLNWNEKYNFYEITLIGHKDKIRVIWDGKTSTIEKL
jgi:hypothetical protein